MYEEKRMKIYLLVNNTDFTLIYKCHKACHFCEIFINTSEYLLKLGIHDRSTLNFDNFSRLHFKIDRYI